MSKRSTPAASVRDVLFVVAVAVFAFMLGAIAAGFEFESESPKLVSASALRDPASGSGMSGHTPALQSSGSVDRTTAHRNGLTTIERRLAPAPIPAPTAPAVVRERFSGDGGGRKDTTSLRDPHNRRSFILETSSLLHRRGWIGLEDRIPEVASGSIDNPVRPAAQRGPE